MPAMKNALRGVAIMNAHTAAATFDTFATPTNVDFLDNVSIQVSWTGTPVGVLEVYASNDQSAYPLGSATPVTWSVLSFGTGVVIAIDGTQTELIINLNQFDYSWVALKYTRTSGTGTITAKVTAKAV